MSVIELKAVSKDYDDNRAVDDVSLAVDKGDILVLLGSSGCGKTTTLRLIAGIEAPDAGEIWLDGQMVAGPGVWMPPEQRRIGMVFQDYALFPHLSVRANVAFALNELPRQQRTRRVMSLLELVGLGHMADRYPHQLSGGEQQRVALARALAPQPSVVLLDEPFSNLDAALRAQMRSEIRSILQQAHMTSIFVTHDQEEALSLADKVAMLRAGKLMQVATPQTLYRRPVNRAVASFVGESNFLTGTADGDTVETALGRLVLAQAAHGDVTVLVRPEMLRLSTNGTDDGGVAARVQWQEYYGHDQRVGLVLTDGRTLVARTDATVIVSDGQPVRVQVDTPVYTLKD